MATKSKTKPAAKPMNEFIDEGTISITVKGGEHEGNHTIDVMAMYFAIEPLHKKHGVGEKDWNSTAEFLNDLSAAVAKQLGWESCSSSVAYDLWHKITSAWMALKKNMPSMQS
jgi:hypothetical protein